jgi:beta-xylosidase
MREEEPRMTIEAVMLWNEPNNLSHWDFELDPEWQVFSEMTILAADAVKAANASLPRVLGGISPIDARFIERMKRQQVLEHIDVVALHGFPLDWNHWQIHDWPEKVPRIHWYSLYDLPKAWPATTRHREAEGSSYYRHFYMGVLKEDGQPKLAAERVADYAPELGICQWFHYEDHRLDDAVRWLKKLGIKRLRTGLSWADHHRPNALEWFDRQMKALEDFDVTVTYCFTPGSRGVRDHYTSPPQQVEEFADFCAEMTKRYA